MPIKIESHPSATGIFTLTNPNSATARGITLPDADTTLVGTDTAQTLTNKTIQGGTIQSASIQGGALTMMTATSASGTTLTFTDLPSWVKRITITFSALSTNGTSNPIVQIGTTSGYEVTGYAGAVGLSTTTSAASSFTTGFGIGTNTAAATVLHALMTIINIDGNLWVASIVGGYSSSATSLHGGGSKTLSGQLDRLRITTLTGTDSFDSGIVNVMYEG